MKISVVLDPVFERHRTGPGHPERPERIRAVANRLRAWDHFSKLHLISPEPCPEEWICTVHSRRHFDAVRETSGKPFSRFDSDTSASEESFHVATLAAGSAIALLDEQRKGRLETGFALVRPPGHHAERDRVMGFCLFNNIAIAAEWALREGMAERVAIVDFDVHHGNGTQSIFYSRPEVLYISTHQSPLYPGTGSFRETGRDRGSGTTVNFPIPAGAEDHFYYSLFQEFILPMLRQYRPDLILVSAGYDAHARDPLAGMRLTAGGFGSLVNVLNETAREICHGRILYLLEGGYHLEALSESILLSIATTLGPAAPPPAPTQEEAYNRYRALAREAFSRHWRLF